MFDENIFVLVIGAIIASMKPNNQLKLVGFIFFAILVLFVVVSCGHKKEVPIMANNEHIVAV